MQPIILMTRISIALILVFFVTCPGFCRPGAVRPSYDHLQGDFKKLSARSETVAEEWRSLVNSCLVIQSASKDKRVAQKSILLAGHALTELHKRIGSVEDLDRAIKCFNEFLKTNRNGPDFIIALRALKEADYLKRNLPPASQVRGESAPVERMAKDSVDLSPGAVPADKSAQAAQFPSLQNGSTRSTPSAHIYNKTGNPFCKRDLVRKAQEEYFQTRVLENELKARRIQESKVSAQIIAKEALTKPKEDQIAEKTPVETLPVTESKEGPPDKTEAVKQLPANAETADSEETKNPATEKRSASLIPPTVIDAPTTSGKKTNFTVVIDPGHGGKDPGAVSGDGSLKEKDIALAVAGRMSDKLRSMNAGIKVLLTRDDDSHLNLQERTAFANANDADLFISIHCNSANDSTSKGIETFYLSKASSNAAMRVAARENDISMSKMSDLEATLLDLMVISKKTESAELATEVHDALGKSLREKGLNGRDRGVKQAPFYVLLGADMPAILVECAFISNGKDRDKLGSAMYLDVIAEGLAKGAFNYLNALRDKNGRSK